MVEDYHNRKMAKKKRKREGQDERPEGKRVRSKKNKTRRICRGLCYQDPFEVRRKGQAPADVQDLVAGDSAAVEDSVAPPKPKRRRKQSPVKESTSINLLASSQHGGTKTPDNLNVATAEALSAYPQFIQQYMLDQGLTGPTPVQERSWPLCYEGKDVQAVAEPGSGKTLAYLLPGIPVMCKHATESCLADDTEACPAMLVLAPTRELAQQIAVSAKPLKKLFGVSSLCLYGGVDKQRQIDAMKQGPQLVVATPGRLLDLIDDDDCPLTLEHVKYVVLDEADKMLSLGLQPQLKRIRSLLIPRKSKPTQQEGVGALVKPHKRQKRPQVLLFTATMPDSLQEAAAKWQRKAAIVHLAPGDMSIIKTVVQITGAHVKSPGPFLGVVQVCAEHKKPIKLLKHLKQIKDSSAGMRNAPKVLVFANRIKTVRSVQQTITEAGFKAAQLHGDRSQAEREVLLDRGWSADHTVLPQEALLGWKCGKAQVLVATDVAARGLHIKNLPYVINYDFPTKLDTYVHRVGRTGRLATNGHAYSFFTRNLAPLARPLLALLKTHNQAVDPNLVRLAEAYEVAATKMQSKETHGGAEELSHKRNSVQALETEDDDV